MANRPPSGSGDEPDYDWLYGRGGRGRDGNPPPSSDPEPTRVMPTTPREDHRGTPPPRGPEPTPMRGRQPEPRPARPSRRRRRIGPFRVLRWLIALWLIFLIVVPIWAWSKIDKVDIDYAGTRPGNQPGRNYLLVGSDSRAGLSAAEKKKLGVGGVGDVGQRTDTIMVLHTGSGPSLLLSIPRDSIVPIPGHGENKINAAFAYGGPKLLTHTIEATTGLHIDDYVEIGFGGFVNTIDAIGGVQICPTQAVKDRRANLNIKKGCQEADGATALAWSRSRHGFALGDVERAKHQRDVISAMGSGVKSPWTFLNPFRYYGVNKAVTSGIKISKGTGPISLGGFAWAMTRVNGNDGLTCSMPIADLAVHWDKERALELLRYLKEDQTDQLPKRLCTPTGMPG